MFVLAHKHKSLWHRHKFAMTISHYSEFHQFSNNLQEAQIFKTFQEAEGYVRNFGFRFRHVSYEYTIMTLDEAEMIRLMEM